MRFIKGLWNFISGLIAVILSFVLVFVLLTIPAMFTVHKVMEPEGLQQMALMLTAMEQPSTDPEDILIKEMIQTNAAKELLTLYKEDLFAQLKGKAPSLDGKALMQIAQDNLEELLPILRNLAQQSGLDISGLGDSQLALLTQQMAAYYGDQLLRNLPSLEELGIQPIKEIAPENIFVVDAEILDRLLSFDFQSEDIPALVTQLIIFLDDYLGLKLLCMVAAVLSLLIVVFRFGHGFRCITWLGGNYLIGGGMGSFLGLYGMMTVKRMFMNPNMPPIEETLQLLLNWFTIGSAAILVLGIVFLIISGCGNSVIQKHRQRRLVQ